MNTLNQVNIVSPHQDDAALSLGLSIRQWARRGVKVNVLNCFTVSRWAPYSRATSVMEVMCIRHREDLAFADRCGAAVTFFDLGALDSPFRLGSTDTKAIFAPKPLSTQDEGTIDDLRIRLDAFLPDGMVLAPLAVRDHIDHRIAREACCRIERPGLVAFYEDLPYSAQIATRDLQDYVLQVERRIGYRLNPQAVEGTSEYADKSSLVSTYASQLEPSDFEALQTVVHMGEKLWLPENASEAFSRLALKN